MSVHRTGSYPAATVVAFTPDGARLLSVHPDGSLSVRALGTDDSERAHVFDAHRDSATTVQQLAVSSDGQWAATAAADGTVLVFQLDALQQAGEFHLSEPALALAFDTAAGVLAAVTAAHSVVLLDVDRRGVSPLTERIAPLLPRAFGSRVTPRLVRSLAPPGRCCCGASGCVASIRTRTPWLPLRRHRPHWRHQCQAPQQLQLQMRADSESGRREPLIRQRHRIATEFRRRCWRAHRRRSPARSQKALTIFMQRAMVPPLRRRLQQQQHQQHQRRQRQGRPYQRIKLR